MNAMARCLVKFAPTKEALDAAMAQFAYAGNIAERPRDRAANGSAGDMESARPLFEQSFAFSPRTHGVRKLCGNVPATWRIRKFMLAEQAGASTGAHATRILSRRGPIDRQIAGFRYGKVQYLHRSVSPSPLRMHRPPPRKVIACAITPRSSSPPSLSHLQLESWCHRSFCTPSRARTLTRRRLRQR